MIRTIITVVVVTIVVCFTRISVYTDDTDGKSLSLMSAEREAKFKKIIPFKLDTQLDKVLNSKNVFYYTENEIPKAHQDWEGQLNGIKDSNVNISANRSEPFGNGNREFPWSGPAGTHLCEGVTSFKFISLPSDDKGAVLPIVYFQFEKHDGTRVLKNGVTRFRDDSLNAYPYGWVFPKGAVVGEVLVLKDPDGFDHVFEIRIRTKLVDKWVVNVYKPFPTSGDLLVALNRNSEWRGNESVQNLIKHLEGPLSSDKYVLKSGHPDSTVFESKKHQDVLPTLDPSVVSKLLSEVPFVSALGATWRGSGPLAPSAPTTTSSYHIVPKSYTAGFVDISSKSCMSCHTSTNKHVDDFDVKRDWYGRIRGSDGIFSFHVFATESIQALGVAPKFNEKMLKNGTIKQYDPKAHLDSVYRRIAGQ